MIKVNFKKIIALLYTFAILFEINVVKSSEDTQLFTSRILRICRDCHRLTKGQLIQLEIWIDELFSTKILSINSKYNLKMCKRKIRIRNHNEISREMLEDKEYINRIKLHKNISKLFKPFKNEISLKDLTLKELNEMQKQPQKKSILYNEMLYKLFDNKNISQAIFFDDLIDSESSVHNEKKLIDDDDKLLKEGIRVSDYFDNDGNPIIQETEHIKIMHKPVKLLIPIEMPLFFTLSRTQKYLYSIQPTELSINYSYSIYSTRVDLEELKYQKTSRYKSDVKDVSESEIIDKSIDSSENPPSPESEKSKKSSETTSHILKDVVEKHKHTGSSSFLDTFDSHGKNEGIKSKKKQRDEYESTRESESSEDSEESLSKETSQSRYYSDEQSSERTEGSRSHSYQLGDEMTVASKDMNT